MDYMRKVKLIALGCKVNQYETQAFKEGLLRRGFSIVDDEASLYIINTCAVTEQAAIKSKKIIQKVKRKNSQAQVVVTGCMVEDYEKELKRMGVDLLIPHSQKHLLLEKILGRENSSKNIWDLKITSFFNKRAYLKIQDGCDSFCSFCAIPYFRGKPLSRPVEDIIGEAERLCKKHPEIVLCGINLALYGKEENFRNNLSLLIKRLLKIEDLKRLRLSSLQPVCLGEDFFSLFENGKMCPHLHLSFQSGDDKVLRLMNKKEDVSLYLNLVKKLRKLNPHIAISCDIMVGFPYEDEKSFANTVRFLKEVRPMRMHIFTFSTRPHTIFENMKLKKSWMIRMKERYSILKRLAEEFSYEYKRNFLGRTLFMVAEEKKDGYICGYTQNYIRVFVEKEIPLGEIVKVKLRSIDKDKVFADAEK